MFGRILVATDGSPTAALAVDRALELAGAVGASLTLLCVGDDEAAARRVVDDELERLRGSAGGVALDAVVETGDPAAGILRVAARDGHDLVVVGNVGMTGDRAHFALGSVPNKVSHALACSLLIVRTDT